MNLTTTSQLFYKRNVGVDNFIGKISGKAIIRIIMNPLEDDEITYGEVNM